ncbi:MAG: ABC transporter permease [Myxococcales bacterium]|nr:ABC transporter permease [Myxococcales bacterium]
MSNVLTIAGRDLGAYFRTQSGYVIFALVLLIDGLLFNAFALGEPDRRSSEVLAKFFYFSSGTTMIASVLISMRLLAEEKQTGTIVLLTSSPLRDRDIVLGKYLSGLTFMAIITLATVYMPLLILVHGKISWGHLAAGYLGLLLLGSATLALGTLGSALARTQVLAAIISGVLVVLLLTCWLLTRVTDYPMNEVVLELALYHRHFPSFTMGLIRLADLLYYAMVSYVALFLAIRALEARRWR